MTAARRPTWRCHVEVDPKTKAECPAWGYADADGTTEQQQHAHYLEHHYQPPEDKP